MSHYHLLEQAMPSSDLSETHQVIVDRSLDGGSSVAIEEIHACPLCGEEDYTEVFYGSDDRHGFQGEFTAVECLGCGLVYLKQIVNPERAKNLYEQYYTHDCIQDRKATVNESHLFTYLEKLGLVSLMRSLHASVFRRSVLFSRYIQKGDSVLDVGCGHGNLAHVVTEQGASWNGLEIDAKRCAYVRGMGYRCFEGTIEEFLEIRSERFDVLLLSHVLEHCHDPVAFIRSCRSALKPGGRLVLASPNYDSFDRRKFGEKWLHWHAPYHVCQFNQSTIGRLAVLSGMTIRSFTTMTPYCFFVRQRSAPRTGSAFLAWLYRLQPIVSLYLLFRDWFMPGDVLIAELVTKGAGEATRGASRG